jgi:hypothetical protein
MATVKKDPAAVALGRKGGKARLQKLTPKKAVAARWAKAKKATKPAAKQKPAAEKVK